MKKTSIVLGIVLVFFASCSLGPRAKPETNFEETRVYRNFERTKIWSASVDAVRQTDFSINFQKMESGIIDARKETQWSDKKIVTLMNVFVVEENGGVKVKCLVAMPGIVVDIEECRLYARLFFQKLNAALGI